MKVIVQAVVFMMKRKACVWVMIVFRFAVTGVVIAMMKIMLLSIQIIENMQVQVIHKAVMLYDNQVICLIIRRVK